MTPTDQTKFLPDVGDCWRACVASLLDYRIQDVPHFFEQDDRMGWLRVDQWLRGRGLKPANLSPWHVPPSMRYVILTGGSPRDPSETHAVIGDLGETTIAERAKMSIADVPIIHDPHPSRSGLSGAAAMLYAIVPIGME